MAGFNRRVGVVVVVVAVAAAGAAAGDGTTSCEEELFNALAEVGHCQSNQDSQMAPNKESRRQVHTHWHCHCRMKKQRGEGGMSSWKWEED